MVLNQPRQSRTTSNVRVRRDKSRLCVVPTIEAAASFQSGASQVLYVARVGHWKHTIFGTKVPDEARALLVRVRHCSDRTAEGKCPT